MQTTINACWQLGTHVPITCQNNTEHTYAPMTYFAYLYPLPFYTHTEAIQLSQTYEKSNSALHRLDKWKSCGLERVAGLLALQGSQQLRQACHILRDPRWGDHALWQGNTITLMEKYQMQE